MGRPKKNPEQVQTEEDVTTRNKPGLKPENPSAGKDVKIKLSDNYYYREIYLSNNEQKIKIYCKTKYSHKETPDKVYKVDNRLVGVYKRHKGSWLGVGGAARNMPISLMAKQTGLTELPIK